MHHNDALRFRFFPASDRNEPTEAGDQHIWNRSVELSAPVLMRSIRRSALIGIFCLLTLLTTACTSAWQMKRAQAQERKGNYSAAVVRYQQIYDHTPERDHKVRSQLLVRLGECLFHMERYSEAYSAFQKATEEDGSNTLAHLRMGELLLSAGVPDRARQQAQIVLDRGLNDK